MDFFRINTTALAEQDFAFIDAPPVGIRPLTWRMAEGERMGKDYPRDAKIYLSDEYPGIVLPSLIGNIRSLLIVARPIQELIEATKIDAEYLPFTLYNHKKRVASRDYFIVNPIGTFDCIDFKKSDVVYSEDAPGVIVKIAKLVLDAKKLAKAPDMFRLEKQPRTYVVSQRLGAEIGKMNPTNFFVHKLEQA